MPNNNPLGPSGAWPSEHCDELRRLCEEGLSYRAIAVALNAKFGTNHNRNAAIGKANRLGLAKKPAVSVPGNRRPRRKRTSAEFGTEQRIKRKYERVRIIPANGNSNAMRVIRTITMDQAKLRCVEIEPRNLSLMDLEARDCRYPYGDGPMTFCGHPKQEGSSYCPDHHALCWVPPRILTDKAPRREAA